jgi:hypothetical protein
MARQKSKTAPQSGRVRFALDGEIVTLDDVDPTRTVLQYLREDLGHTGTKEGCAEDIAHALGKDPLDVRKLNFYGVAERNVTHYHQTIVDNVIHDIVADLEQSADYRERRHAIRAFNAKNPYVKRGIALTPVKFGISFTATHLNRQVACCTSTPTAR